MSAKTHKQIGSVVEGAVEVHPHEPSSLLLILRQVNRELHCLPEEALRCVSERLNVPLAHVYHAAAHCGESAPKPRGKHTIKLCMGTGCYVRGAPKILQQLCRKLNISPGETTADGEFAVETVTCLGNCTSGPTVQIDDEYRKVSLGMIDRLLIETKEGRARPLDSGPVATAPVAESFIAKAVAHSRASAKGMSIAVCGGTGCRTVDGEQVAAAVEKGLKDLDISKQVKFRKTGCCGFCERGPILTIMPKDIVYQRVTAADVPEIISRSVIGGEVIERLVEYEPEAGKLISKRDEIPFFALQERIILGDNGQISPERIEDYISSGGYKALAKALEIGPECVVGEIEESGLRERSGIGSLIGKRWKSYGKAHDETKYAICNADEDDPASCVTRSLLEGNPHRVLEGMIIGGYAVGAREGYVYVRDECSLAARSIAAAMEQARDKGYLGPNIMDSGFDFDVRVAGRSNSFLCRESTALGTSVEGRTSESDRNGASSEDRSAWHSVETWANVPLIAEKGAGWYGSVGTKSSKGSKIFSLVGKIERPGLVEVPMGTTLRQIVFDIGGGIPNGKSLKAVHTGGYAGGFLPERMLDLKMDFDESAKAGAMMGSGGITVMDETSCVIDMTKHLLHSRIEESCGKCLPCRDGIYRIYEILDRITCGKGKTGDIEALEELGRMTPGNCLCSLGSSVANPILSTLRYFRDEYASHIQGGRCHAGVCKELSTYTIDDEKCTACDACKKTCAGDAVTGTERQPRAIDQSKCVKCGICLDACNFDAVKLR